MKVVCAAVVGLLPWFALVAQTEIEPGVWLADSVAQADVQAAVNAAGTEETVYLPPGDETWTTSLTIPRRMYVVGSGVGQTIIRNNITSGDRRIFNFEGGGGDHGFGHIEFVGAGGSENGDGYFDVGWGAAIGHCKFDNVGSGNGPLFIEFGGFLMFDCEVILEDFHRIAIMKNGSDGTIGAGHGDWEIPADLGFTRSFYLEGCTVTKTGSVYGMLDGWQGGHSVVRFCDITGTNIANHGTESSEILRGHRFLETYHNTMDLTTTAMSTGFHHLRGGMLIAFNNEMLGTERAFLLSAYRVVQAFAPWGQADGTSGFDVNDTSDDGTGFDDGPAGDGVFESGTFTSTGDYTMTDTTKDWTGQSWVRYTCRYVFDLTASSSTSTTITVSPDPGWDTTANDGRGEWNGWEFTHGGNGQKGVVFSNTSDTLTLNGSTWPVPANVSTVTDFQLSRAGYIVGSTATTLTLNPKDVGGVIPEHVWPLGGTYEIRRVLDVMDCTGMGAQSTAFSGIRPQHTEAVTRAWEPAYIWNNTRDSGGGPVQIGASAGAYADIFVKNEDWLEDEADVSTNPGVQVGTRATMDATTAADVGSAFWVTDEADWNQTTPGIPDGQLYVWNGASWDLYYTPLVYPHPDQALLPEAYVASGSAYTGRLRLDNTKRPIKADGTGRPYIFAN